MDVERRKYTRFSVSNNTFSALGREFETIGKVIDISIKGLTLSYICESNKVVLDRGFSQIDIFLLGNTFYLSKVPCKIVHEIQDPKSMKENGIVIRQCGLQFGKLSKSQSEQLELFIENYAIDSLYNSFSS